MSPHQDATNLVYLLQASNPLWVLIGNQTLSLLHRQEASLLEIFYLYILCFRISKMTKQSSKAHTGTSHLVCLGQTSPKLKYFILLVEFLNLIYEVKKVNYTLVMPLFVL